MKTESHISKWINGNTLVKMVAGLALGAMLMTAIALPSNASADGPTKPVTSGEQLVIMAEIDDGVMGIVDYKRDRVGLSDTGAVGVLLAVLSHDEGSNFSEEEWVQLMGEQEDGVMGVVDYKRDQVGVSGTGAVGVLLAVLSHDEGSYFSEEEWIHLMGEQEDELV